MFYVKTPSPIDHARSSYATRWPYQRIRDMQKPFHLLIERAGSPDKLGLGVSVSHITRSTTRVDRPIGQPASRPAGRPRHWRTLENAPAYWIRWVKVLRSVLRKTHAKLLIASCDCAENLEIAEIEATYCSGLVYWRWTRFRWTMGILTSIIQFSHCNLQINSYIILHNG